MRLEGKVALVTGGGTGIGAAIARRFVADGAKVCITGRRKEMLDRVAASLPAESIATCVGDVSRHEDIERMVESTLKLGGKLNVLVNNAAKDQIPPANVVDLDPELWQQVLAVNLNTGDAGVVTNNYSSLGNPSFSVDDKKIYYHYINQSSSQYQVWAVDLLTDGITGSGSDVKQLDGGVYPLAFAVGTRPTDVPVSAELPQGCLLEQNYPNPFNPGTRISFQIPVAGKVTLKVYDILGREVATLVDAQVPAGVHAVPFDGSGLSSGVYLYRLDAGGVTQSRRMIMAK